MKNKSCSLLLLLLTACTPNDSEHSSSFSITTDPSNSAKTTAPKLPSSEESNHIVCSEPRLQMCTREYLPVCATRDTEVRCVTTPCPSTELKTYSNKCEACADNKVMSYVLGACETNQ